MTWNDEMVAAGGLCTSISDAYAVHGTVGRPVRDVFVRMLYQQRQRQALPADERPAFDIRNRGFCESGRPDIAAKVSEIGAREDDDDDELFYGHEWDEPVRLHFTWRHRD